MIVKNTPSIANPSFGPKRQGQEKIFACAAHVTMVMTNVYGITV